MHKRLRYKNRPRDVNVYFYGNRMKFLNTNDHSHLEIIKQKQKVWIVPMESMEKAVSIL